jgi:hypothetical protein
MRLLDRLSIKSKLIAMLLAVSGCSIMAIAYLGYRSGQENLTERVFSQLTSVRASKADRIEAYFQMIPAAIVNRTIERQPSFAREISQILELRRRAIQSAISNS